MNQVSPVIDKSQVAVLGPPASLDQSPAISSTALRVWFVIYLLWLGGLALVARLSYAALQQGQSAGLHVWWICLGTFYVSLANNFVPLPTMWMIMLLASKTVGLPGAIPVRIAYVAAITAVATAMANLNEYHLLRWALGSRVASKVRHTRLVQWAIRWFRVSPFGILTLASFVPIPIDAVRWVAIADGYGRGRFFWANFIGRWVRYALLAGATIWFNAGPRAIFAIQACIVVITAGPVLVRLLQGRKPSSGDAYVPSNPS